MLGTAARRSIDEVWAKYNHNHNRSSSSTTCPQWRSNPVASHLSPPRILQLPKPTSSSAFSSRRRTNRRPKGSDSRQNECDWQERSQKSHNTSGAKVKSKSRGKLEALFGQEREFSRSVPIVLLHPSSNSCCSSPRREKVTLCDDAREIFEEVNGDGRSSSSSSAVIRSDGEEGKCKWASEDWKFQADVLRAECNLLRMEKAVAMRRWEQCCAEMQHALRMAHSLHSALQTLFIGRNKIVDEKNAEVVLQSNLENQIVALQQKLEKLQENAEFRENELNKCTNFDRQALYLQRTLDNLCQSSKDRAYAYAALAEDTAKSLQQRLQVLLSAASSDYSLELLESEKDEVCVSDAESEAEEDESHRHLTHHNRQLLLTCFASRSSSKLQNQNAKQKNGFIDPALLTRRLDSLSVEMNERKEAAAQIRKEYRSMLSTTGSSRRTTPLPAKADEGALNDNILCSGKCKAAIRKIAEQVQAETEQWSQVHDILRHVREEMEDLQKSRDFWEDYAIEAARNIKILETMTHEWKEKARLSEEKVHGMQEEITRLRNEIRGTKVEQNTEETQKEWNETHYRFVYQRASTQSEATKSELDFEISQSHGASVSKKLLPPRRNNSLNPAASEDDENSENDYAEYACSSKYMQIAGPKVSKGTQTCDASAGTTCTLNEKHPGTPLTKHRHRSNRRLQILCSKENRLSPNHNSPSSATLKGSSKHHGSYCFSPLSDIANVSPSTK